MSFRFNKNFTDVINTYEQFWNRKLNRALIPVMITGYDPSRPKPNVNIDDMNNWGFDQAMFGNRDISPADIVDIVDYGLSTIEYLGDYYPCFNLNFTGPGVLAAYLGADVKVIDRYVWFFGERDIDIRDLHFEYDPNNYWLNRTKDIIIEGKKAWGNDIVIGMPDLGGVIDVLVSFIRNEKLMLNLYDHPQEIKRLIDEIHDIWHRVYDELAEIHSKGFAYTDWSSLLSKEPLYMLQCDFCYMIGTGMFDEFVKQELSDSCKKLSRGCYHLDGVGQLSHLDSLLEIENLKLVQWVPGAGTTPADNWNEPFDKILNSGKLLQMGMDPLESSLIQLDNIISRRGSLKNISHYIMSFEYKERDKALKILDKYGVDV